MRRLIGIGILIILTSSIIVQWEDVSVKFNRIGSTNGYIFTAENIPYYVDSTCTENCDERNGVYMYRWLLSNGKSSSTRALKVATGTTGTIIDTFYFHTYNPIWARLSIVAVYDDDDKPKELFANPPEAEGSTIQSFVLPPDFDSSYTNDSYLKLNTTSPVKPRDGDSITYVLNYGNPCNDTISGNISIIYDSEKVFLEGVTDCFSSTDPELGGSPFTTNFIGLPKDSSRSLYLSMHFLTDDSIQLIVEREITSGEKWNPGRCSLTVSDTIMIDPMRHIDPHDPNYITSLDTAICPKNPPSTISYYIVFQNIGNGPADSVTVKLNVPECFLFKPAEIQTLEPIKNINNSNQPLSFTITGDREITWIMTDFNGYLKSSTTGSKLRGLMEINFSSLYTEDDTKDSIKVEFTVDPNYKFNPCDKIPISAEIIFEDKESIFTNSYLFSTLCNDCTPCTEDPEIKRQDTISYYGDAVKLHLPKDILNENCTCSWYPTKGLDNPRSCHPRASPNASTTYTAIVTEDCISKIIKVPVKVCKKPVCWPRCQCENHSGHWFNIGWWIQTILLILILLTILYYLSKGKRNKR